MGMQPQMWPAHASHAITVAVNSGRAAMGWRAGPSAMSRAWLNASLSGIDDVLLLLLQLQE